MACVVQLASAAPQLIEMTDGLLELSWTAVVTLRLGAVVEAEDPFNEGRHLGRHVERAGAPAKRPARILVAHQLDSKRLAHGSGRARQPHAPPREVFRDDIQTVLNGKRPD